MFEPIGKSIALSPSSILSGGKSDFTHVLHANDGERSNVMASVFIDPNNNAKGAHEIVLSRGNDDRRSRGGGGSRDHHQELVGVNSKTNAVLPYPSNPPQHTMSSLFELLARAGTELALGYDSLARPPDTSYIDAVDDTHVTDDDDDISNNRKSHQRGPYSTAQSDHQGGPRRGKSAGVVIKGDDVRLQPLPSVPPPLAPSSVRSHSPRSTHYYDSSSSPSHTLLATDLALAQKKSRRDADTANNNISNTIMRKTTASSTHNNKKRLSPPMLDVDDRNNEEGNASEEGDEDDEEGNGQPLALEERSRRLDTSRLHVGAALEMLETTRDGLLEIMSRWDAYESAHAAISSRRPSHSPQPSQQQHSDLFYPQIHPDATPLQPPPPPLIRSGNTQLNSFGETAQGEGGAHQQPIGSSSTAHGAGPLVVRVRRGDSSPLASAGRPASSTPRSGESRHINDTPRPRGLHQMSFSRQNSNSAAAVNVLSTSLAVAPFSGHGLPPRKGIVRPAPLSSFSFGSSNSLSLSSHVGMASSEPSGWYPLLALAYARWTCFLSLRKIENQRQRDAFLCAAAETVRTRCERLNIDRSILRYNLVHVLGDANARRLLSAYWRKWHTAGIARRVHENARRDLATAHKLAEMGHRKAGLRNAFYKWRSAYFFSVLGSHKERVVVLGRSVDQLKSHFAIEMMTREKRASDRQRLLMEEADERARVMAGESSGLVSLLQWQTSLLEHEKNNELVGRVADVRVEYEKHILVSEAKARLLSLESGEQNGRSALVEAEDGQREVLAACVLRITGGYISDFSKKVEVLEASLARALESGALKDRILADTRESYSLATAENNSSFQRGLLSIREAYEERIAIQESAHAKTIEALEARHAAALGHARSLAAEEGNKLRALHLAEGRGSREEVAKLQGHIEMLANEVSTLRADRDQMEARHQDEQEASKAAAMRRAHALTQTASRFSAERDMVTSHLMSTNTWLNNVTLISHRALRARSDLFADSAMEQLVALRDLHQTRNNQKENDNKSVLSAFAAWRQWASERRAAREIAALREDQLLLRRELISGRSSLLSSVDTELDELSRKLSQASEENKSLRERLLTSHHSHHHSNSTGSNSTNKEGEAPQRLSGNTPPAYLSGHNATTDDSHGEGLRSLLLISELRRYEERRRSLLVEGWYKGCLDLFLEHIGRSHSAASINESAHANLRLRLLEALGRVGELDEELHARTQQAHAAMQRAREEMAHARLCANSSAALGCRTQSWAVASSVLIQWAKWSKDRRLRRTAGAKAKRSIGSLKNSLVNLRQDALRLRDASASSTMMVVSRRIEEATVTHVHHVCEEFTSSAMTLQQHEYEMRRFSEAAEAAATAARARQQWGERLLVTAWFHFWAICTQRRARHRAENDAYQLRMHCKDLESVIAKALEVKRSRGRGRGEDEEGAGVGGENARRRREEHSPETSMSPSLSSSPSPSSPYIVAGASRAQRHAAQGGTARDSVARSVIHTVTDTYTTNNEDGAEKRTRGEMGGEGPRYSAMLLRGASSPKPSSVQLATETIPVGVCDRMLAFSDGVNEGVESANKALVTANALADKLAALSLPYSSDNGSSGASPQSDPTRTAAQNASAQILTDTTPEGMRRGGSFRVHVGLGKEEEEEGTGERIGGGGGVEEDVRRIAAQVHALMREVHSSPLSVLETEPSASSSNSAGYERQRGVPIAVKLRREDF